MMVLGVLFLLVACEFHAGSSRQLKKEVDSFAVYYFNWQFHQAVRFVTPESEKWMHYAASQVHQADIDLLQSKELPASCEINEVVYSEDDKTAIAHVTIQNYLRMDTIGKAATIVNAAQFDIPLIYQAETDKWKVEVNELLRPVK
ncbi:MAG: hypothetical protein J6P64_00695 [Bacteroidales bacterium]|nr:hypothetical protein [Bacteroidales bacterium]